MMEEALHQAQVPSTELLQRWIQKQADLIIAERKVEQEESRLLLSKCPPRQLERHGLAILGLGVQSISIGLGGKTLIELERPAAYHSISAFPPHSLRSGDIIQLEDHDFDATQAKGKARENAVAISGVVYRVSETKIIIAVASNKGKGGEGGGGGGEMPDVPTRIRLVKVANEATFDRMEHFLVRLSKLLHVSVKTSRKLAENASSSSSSESEGEILDSKNESSSSTSALVASLFAQMTPTWSKEFQETPLPLINSNLNPSQISAIQFSLQANHFALIHGPPGTGKTTVVAELVLQLAIVQKKSILVCGASNLAADNLLERIVVKGGDDLTKSGIGVTRLGRKLSTSKECC